MKTSSESMWSGTFFNRAFKLGLLIFIICFVMFFTSSYWCNQSLSNNIGSIVKNTRYYRYPLTHPIRSKNGVKYKIAVISDLDKDRSKSPGKLLEWRSYLKIGYLIQDRSGYKVEFSETHTLTTNLNEKGRGLELSELCMFTEKLYSADDRTGVVYEVINNEPIPWVILQDGDGSSKKGFKCEWMTVKNDMLYIGSMGKERTTSTGEFQNLNPMFVKSVSTGGSVTHHNWTDHYIAIRSKLGIKFPGYILHEAVTWSEKKKRWFFLPRRMSKLKYDEDLDEKRGANVLISASEDFSVIDIVYVGELDNTHGFSSFKFIPGTNDNMIIALKTKEVGDDVSSYIVVFEVSTGKVLMHEQLLANDKYEGIEFL